MERNVQKMEVEQEFGFGVKSIKSQGGEYRIRTLENIHCSVSESLSGFHLTAMADEAEGGDRSTQDSAIPLKASGQTFESMHALLDTISPLYRYFWHLRYVGTRLLNDCARNC